MPHASQRRARGPLRSPIRLTAALVVAVLAVAGATGADAATPHSGARAVSSEGAAPPLALQSQTGWVVEGQAFDLHLRTSSATVPTAQLGITVAVYPCLSSISGFDQSLGTGSLGTPVSSTTSALPVDSLRALPTGGVDLSMPVVVGSASSAATPAPAFTIHLLPVTGQCRSFPAGVFPVRVQLVDTSGGPVLGSFTTHLIYSQAPATTQRLRVAVVLPLQITQGASRLPTTTELLTRPSAALATPTVGTVDALTATVTTVAVQHPSVPVTLQVSGQTVGLLDTPAHRSTINQLGDLAAAPGVDELTAAPFTPVDANALVDTGLSAELALQVARGVQVVDTATGRAPPQQAAGQPPDLGAWITGGGLDPAAVGSLAADGFDQVVLPASQLSATPTNGSTTSPFTLTVARGTTVSVMASDDDLTARFSADPGNPALAAHQLVAELAQLYYELPNGLTPRAVMAVAPTGWNDDPAFVDALLGSLDGNPLVKAVTTAQLFALFPTPATCRSGCRLTSSGGSDGLPVAAIQAQRVQVNGFAVSAVGAHTLGLQLGDLVLAGEAVALRPSQQSAVLANAGDAISAQFGQLTVGGDKSVTLTARSGRVPITIVSTAPYPVTATLTLSSDKLLFPNGQTLWSEQVNLVPRYSNVKYVRVQTRTSGDFRLDVTLHAPVGPVRLATGELSVRSTSSSVVGVALTVGAVVVLAVWWFRTSRRRRAPRGVDEADEAEGDRPPSDGPDPVGVGPPDTSPAAP
ncbi:MAG TPA: DUF6049 family protein [Acidimicrobiales bacterium]